MTEPLQKILELEKKNLKRMEALVQRGSVPQVQLNEAQRRILLAEVHLAEAKSKSSPQLATLQSDLLESSIQRAEKQARLGKVEELLNSVTSSRDVFQQAKDIAKQVEQINSELFSNSSRVKIMQSKITVLNDAIDAEKKK